MMVPDSREHDGGMGRNHEVFGLLAVLAAAPAMAAEPLPADLMHKCEPLDPLCFDSWADSSVVDVATCGQSDHIVPLEPAPNAVSGWHGYTYRLSDIPEDAPIRGWIAWRYLGETAAGQVVETYHHGGGTGQFTGVQTVRREGDRLRLVAFHAGGDRCNGGIATAAVAGGVVASALHITPYDLLSLALGEDGVPFEAYDDIAACAICCIGTATFVGDDLAWVMLSPPEDGLAAEEGDGHQACFDSLLRDSQRNLNAQELEQLGQKFLVQCGPAE